MQSAVLFLTVAIHSLAYDDIGEQEITQYADLPLLSSSDVELFKPEFEVTGDELEAAEPNEICREYSDANLRVREEGVRHSCPPSNAPQNQENPPRMKLPVESTGRRRKSPKPSDFKYNEYGRLTSYRGEEVFPHARNRRMRIYCESPYGIACCQQEYNLDDFSVILQDCQRCGCIILEPPSTSPSEENANNGFVDSDICLDSFIEWCCTLISDPKVRSSPTEVYLFSTDILWIQEKKTWKCEMPNVVPPDPNLPDPSSADPQR